MQFDFKEKYTFKTELHAHTSPVSSCSEMPPEELVKAYVKCGYNTIVITNHFFATSHSEMPSKEYIEFYLNDYRKTREFGEKLGLNVLLGAEVRFPQNCNDYLVFGIEENDISDIWGYLSGDYKSFYENYRSENRIIVQAHPFRSGISLQEAQYLDGIEALNAHPNHNSRNQLALKYASEHPEFILTCGTDYHHPNHEGMVALLTENEITTSNELVKALKSRNYLFGLSNKVVVPY